VEAADDLEALAWASQDDPELLDLVVERWRERGELAGELAALDRRFGSGGYSRENLSMSHEREEDELYLAERADPRLLPVLLGWTRAGKGQLEALIARIGDERAVPVLRGRLDVGDDFHHNRTRALLALTRMGRLEGQRERLEGWLASERLDTDFTASIHNGDLVNACIDALGAFGESAAIPCLQGLLAEEAREYKKIRPRVAVALWRLGDAAGLSVLQDLDEDERLAILAPHAIDALDLDLAASIGQALDRPRYSRDDTITNRITALRALAAADLPAELAAPWVHTYHHGVREAALAVFAARGVEPPPVRLLYKADVAAMSRAEVLEALADPSVVLGYNLAVRLAEDPHPSAAPALADFVRRHAADERRWATGDDSDYDIYWAVWALSKLDVPEGNAVMNELLMGDRKGRWWPVMKHPGTGPELIPGMQRMKERGLAWMRSTAEEWLEENSSGQR